MTSDMSDAPDFGLGSGDYIPGGLSPDFGARIGRAATFLKALSHEGRLLILCHLSHGERSVTQLEALLGLRQAAVSQQLARLRIEGLVNTRRDGKSIYYSISDPRVVQTVGLIRKLFDPED